jgi:hypothetical protein
LFHFGAFVDDWAGDIYKSTISTLLSLVLRCGVNGLLLRVLRYSSLIELNTGAAPHELF